MIRQNLVSWSRCTAAVAVAVALLAITGCNPMTDDSTTRELASPADAAAGNPSVIVDTNANTPLSDETDHGHKPGAHGGIMVSLGRDSYHVEAVIDSEGKVRLYTLGKDESRVIDVESQTLKGFVKADGDVDSKAIAFEPSPQEGDAAGKTSLFVGQLPAELVGQSIDVTIPNIRIDGERFRLGFVSGLAGHSDETTSMPEKLADSAEKELYLVPAGRYTAKDIEANGSVTASQKFKGIKSAHDMNPKSGDLICPITQTKANPKFSWIVDGKTYQFCCPPCVDEFVKMAKDATEPLTDPQDYKKQ